MCASPEHDPYAALRAKDFRLLLGGGFLSLIGNSAVGTALAWEVYERTNDKFALGLLGLVQAAPVMAFALPAGHLVDRLEPRRVLLATTGLTAAVCAGLAALSWLQGPIGWVYACVFVLGVSRAFAGPAAGSLLPSIVTMDLLPNAISWRLMVFQGTMTAGPVLAGKAIKELGGVQWIYIAGAALIGANLLFLALLRPRALERSTEREGWKAVGAGLRFLGQTKILLAAMLLDLFAVLLGGATALLPVYAKDILAVGPEGLGWLRAAPGAGALLITLALAHRPPLRRAGAAMLWAVAGYGVATIAFGLSESFYLSLAMLFLTGLTDALSVVVRHTLVQMRTPDAMRGRVSAVNGLFISASNELGAFESGTVAHLCGPVFSVVSGGAGTLVVVLGIAWAFPQLRKLGRLDEKPG